jgi:hypothetical protein
MRQVAASRLPMMTTLGNHEWFDDVQFSFTAYLNRFDNPLVNGKRELYYSYNAGLVHWVMVAGYCPEMKLTSTQPCLAAGSPNTIMKQNYTWVGYIEIKFIVIIYTIIMNSTSIILKFHLLLTTVVHW